MGLSSNYNPEKVMNGTYGYAYFNGEELLELESFKIKDAISYEDIKQPGQLRAGQKMVSIEGSGEITIYRLNHRILKKYAAAIDEGKQPTVDITTTIADPNSEESQTMTFYDCTIEELNYVATEPGTIIKDSFPFHYRERKFVD